MATTAPVSCAKASFLGGARFFSGAWAWLAVEVGALQQQERGEHHQPVTEAEREMVGLLGKVG
jgi:hypothetical protein